MGGWGIVEPTVVDGDVMKAMCEASRKEEVEMTS